MEVKVSAKLRGVFTTECWRKGLPKDLSKPYQLRVFPDGLRHLVWEDVSQNIITDQGLNHILNVWLHAATQITTWYCVISETNTAASSGLTYSVPSFTELQAYDGATRPEYNEANSTAKSTTNSANKAVFTINATKTLYGAALVGGGTAATTKGDTAGGGTLGCYALFGSSRGVIATDIINLTYTVTSADDGV